MNTSFGSRYPMFVQTDADRLRWKASLDIATALYGLELPRDIDLLQMLARSAYNSEIPTVDMLGPPPDDRPE